LLPSPKIGRGGANSLVKRIPILGEGSKFSS
jgi:hypothetical protein